MSYVLVINSGSSSIKFQMVDPTASAEDAPFVSGLVEQIGEDSGSITISHDGQKYRYEESIPNHTKGLDYSISKLEELGVGPTQVEIIAVGHRVVHGGTVFSQPVFVNDEVVDKIREQIPLAPLHNPSNIDGMEVARKLLPDVPQVAVFDTAFFAELPEYSSRYAINRQVADEANIRRYGFHGTSHQFVSQAAADFLKRDNASLNQITLHLGNGASAAAIRGGHPIDTSMGLTPLAGLVMGTRSGDIDPGIVFHLARNYNMSIGEIDNMLNKQSGMRGLTGFNDFRDIHAAIDKGDENAKVGYQIYIHQLRRVLGSYMIGLGKVDVISFTAGVGENDAQTRADALANLEMYGIIIDPEANVKRVSGSRVISAADSEITVLVVPTNEELAIARKSAELVQK